jgi:hypothetical protein
MADSMSKNSRQLVASSKLFIVISLLFTVGAYAEELADPTKPPASLSAPASVTGEVAVVKPAGLQSILISKQRRAAIIDGETVELGGIHGAAKLIEVNEGNVVLRSAQGRQVLSLFPDVSKISRKELVRSAQTGSKADAIILKAHSGRDKK